MTMVRSCPGWVRQKGLLFLTVFVSDAFNVLVLSIGRRSLPGTRVHNRVTERNTLSLPPSPLSPGGLLPVVGFKFNAYSPTRPS